MRPDPLSKFHADGVLSIDEYLDVDTVHSLLAALESWSVQDGEAAAVRVKRGVTFARRNLLSAPCVQSFMRRSDIQSLVQSIAPGSVAERVILFDKTGKANWTVPWHQDRSIAVRERRDVAGFGPWSTKAGVVHVQPPVEILRHRVTLRFSLDACDADNGPLRAIAGTHQGILDQSELDEAVVRGPESLCTTAIGGLVIMRPLVVHASSPAKRVGHRRVLHIEFGPPHLPGGLEWARA